MSLQNFHSLYEWRKDGKEASALHSIFTQSSITYKTDVWTSGKIVSENKFKRKNWAWTFSFAQDTVIIWANRITIGSQKLNEKNRFRHYKKNTKILIDDWIGFIVLFGNYLTITLFSQTSITFFYHAFWVNFNLLIHIQTPNSIYWWHLKTH